VNNENIGDKSSKGMGGVKNDYLSESQFMRKMGYFECSLPPISDGKEILLLCDVLKY